MTPCALLLTTWDSYAKTAQLLVVCAIPIGHGKRGGSP